MKKIKDRIALLDKKITGKNQAHLVFIFDNNGDKPYKIEECYGNKTNTFYYDNADDYKPPKGFNGVILDCRDETFN